MRIVMASLSSLDAGTITNILLGVLTVLVIPLVNFVVSLLRTLLATLQDLEKSIGELQTKLGTINPPEGLLGDTASLKREVSRHRDWLIEINSALDHPIRIDRS